MKVVLYHPPPINVMGYFGEHLGFGYISRILRQEGIDTQIIDAFVENMNMRQSAELLLKINPDILGLSIYQEGFSRIKILVAFLREKGYKGIIAFGGNFASLCYRDILLDVPEVDIVFVGESEYAFLELVQKVGRGKDFLHIKGIAYRNDSQPIFTGIDNRTFDLDKLPFPDRELLQKLSKMPGVPVQMASSRGCYANCSFCTVNAFYTQEQDYAKGVKKWRWRSAENVVDEMEALCYQFKDMTFKFIDDNFIGLLEIGAERASKIADEIMRRHLNVKFMIECRANDVRVDVLKRLKEAGLISVFIGIESADDKFLRNYRKGTTVQQNQRALDILRALNLHYKMGFILFDPYSDLNQLKQNIDFLRENKTTVIHSYRPIELMVYSGTALAEELKNLGKLKGDYLNYSYEYINSEMVVGKNAMKYIAERIKVYKVQYNNYKIQMNKIYKTVGRKTDCGHELLELLETVRELMESINKTFINLDKELSDWVVGCLGNKDFDSLGREGIDRKVNIVFAALDRQMSNTYDCFQCINNSFNVLMHNWGGRSIGI